MEQNFSSKRLQNTILSMEMS